MGVGGLLKSEDSVTSISSLDLGTGRTLDDRAPRGPASLPDTELATELGTLQGPLRQDSGDTEHHDQGP